MIVDDHESIRFPLSRTLSREGYEVLLADDYEIALDILREKKVNVILSDIIMPKVDGLRLLKLSKMIKPEVAVILITEQGTIKKAVDAMKDGAYDFVTKPFKKIIIVNMIKKAIEKQAVVIESNSIQEQLPNSENNIYKDIFCKAMQCVTL